VGLDAAGTWVAGATVPKPWSNVSGVALVQNRAPKAVLSVPSTDQMTDQPFPVDASHSSDPDGDAISYRWDLDGNGSFETDTGSAPQATASFATGGDHTISLQVRDANGALTATSATAHVVAPPVVQQDPAEQQPPQDQPPLLPPPPGADLPSTAPSVSATIPAQVTLTQLLSPTGVLIPLTCTSDCVVVGTLQISLHDLQSLAAAQRLITIGSGSVTISAGKKGKLRIRLTPKMRKRLKIALGSASAAVKRKIKLNLTLHTKYKSGKKKTIRRKIVLKG
jgi:hypothetical protein